MTERSTYRPVKERDGLRWLIVAGLKALPLAIILGGIATFVLLALSSSGSSEAETRARIGLTDEVKWPFFDPVTERTLQSANSDELDEYLVSTVGSTSYVLTSELPDQLTAIVDIVVVAEDAATTEVVAVAAADWVVVQNEADRIARLNTDIELATAELAEVDALLVVAVETADETAVALAATEDEATIERLKRELRLANDEIDSYQVRTLELEAEISATERQLANLAPEIEVVNVTTVGTETERPTTVAFAAGLAVAILAVFAQLIYQREFGAISSSKQLEDVLEVPVSTYPSRPESAQLLGLFRPLNEAEPSVVGVVRGGTELGDPDDLVERLSELGLSVRVGEPELVSAGAPVATRGRSSKPPERIAMVDLDAELEGSAEISLGCDSALLVVDRKSESVRSVRSSLDLIDELGLPLLGVLLVEGSSSNGSS